MYMYSFVVTCALPPLVSTQNVSEFVDHSSFCMSKSRPDIMLWMSVSGVPHTLARLANAYLLYPSLGLPISGLNSRFCHCFLYKLILRLALVNNMATAFVSFGDVCSPSQWSLVQGSQSTKTLYISAYNNLVGNLHVCNTCLDTNTLLHKILIKDQLMLSNHIRSPFIGQLHTYNAGIATVLSVWKEGALPSSFNYDKL